MDLPLRTIQNLNRCRNWYPLPFSIKIWVRLRSPCLPYHSNTTLAVLLAFVLDQPMATERTSNWRACADPREDGSPDGGQRGLGRRAGVGHFFPAPTGWR